MTRVIVNGSFDILHIGHIGVLEHARAYPNSYVLVLTDSDRRIKQLKGKERPVNNEYYRAKMLSSLRFVDRVEIFDSDQELIDYIREFDPDVMVKGSDYRGRPILGFEYCRKIDFYEHTGHSTTGLVQRLINW